ncbi:MAG: NHLP bacteriocin export ABC transporter permease/ATPase subunit [bacterium]|nr:NHLP bacteriocin export ABC transporter permease/ATPase subunit [bacterium]
MGSTADDIKIRIKGGHMYLTSDPDELFYVEKGPVNLYIVKTHHGNLGRSIFLCEIPEHTWIPTLSVAKKGDEYFWQFLFMAQDTAELSIASAAQTEMDTNSLFSSILLNIPNFPEGEEIYPVRLAKYYEEIIGGEKLAIAEMLVEKNTIRANRANLILSLFMKKGFVFPEKTESPIYNVMSIYCDYMKIKLCSYQTAETICGKDFAAHELARISHFIIRQVTLEEQWYMRDNGPLIAYLKETGQPVICIPKGISRYMMYDVEQGSASIVDAEVAAKLDVEGIMAYRSFPSTPMKFKQVAAHGIQTIKARDIVTLVLMSLFGVLIGLLIPYLNEKLFDELIPMGSMTPIMQVGMVIFSCAIGNVFFLLVKNLSTLRATKSLEYSIMSATFDRLFHLPQQFIEKYGSTDLVTRIMSVSTVFQTLSTGFVSAALGFVFSLLYLIRMFRQSKALAGRGVVMVLITVLLTLLFGYLCIRYERKKLESSTKSNVVLYQFISNIMKVKIGGIEERALLEFQKHNTETVKNDMKSTNINNISSMITNAMVLVYAGFIYYTVIHKKIDITIGQYTAFYSAFGMFSAATTQLARYFLSLGMIIPVYRRVKPIFQECTELGDEGGTVNQFQGQIEAYHLTFRYSEDEKPVLNDVTFKIAPGEYVAIVGESGGGKSTLLKCLLGFEKPTLGKIYYDDIDIDVTDKRELRKQLGVVLQDGHLTTGTIFSNVAISSPRITPEEVEALMREVGMGDDIARMPMGVFTEISERGGTVSGGQQQRILIARALANNPVMLFFDEATSALDNITQQEVIRNIEKRQITRVVIAHRLSTVQNCDRILVLSKGEIAEQGTYEELMQKQGLFYELVNRQRVQADL